MPLLLVLFVVAVIVPIGVGVLAHRRAWSVAGGPSAWGRAAAARLGPVRGPIAVVVIGYAVTAVVGLVLGFLAKSLEPGVDKPIFRWVHPRVHAGSEITTAMTKLTSMGLNTNVQLVVLVAGIVLACAFGRRWWLPVVALGVALLGEKYLQKFLGRVVDRGHPPTTLGTYPSGGVGRILAVYCVVVALVIVLLPTLGRAWRAGLWTGLATAAVVEAFTRVFLSLHWFTDALFALPFGALLLLTNVAAIAAATAGVGPGTAASAGRPGTAVQENPIPAR